MNYHIKNHNELYTVVIFFIASALLLTSLIVSNDAIAQPSNGNKLTKDEKCASGDLPPSACKKVSDRNQVNSGGAGIIAGQTGGAGDGAGTESSPVGSNTANSAINQNQQSTQSCATGNVKVLPHSTFTCTNTANQDQANNGSISTNQTADGEITNP